MPRKTSAILAISAALIGVGASLSVTPPAMAADSGLTVLPSSQFQYDIDEQLTMQLDGRSTRQYEKYHFDYSTVPAPKKGEWNQPASIPTGGYRAEPLPARGVVVPPSGEIRSYEIRLPGRTAAGRVQRLWGRLCARDETSETHYRCSPWTEIQREYPPTRYGVTAPTSTGENGLTIHSEVDSRPAVDDNISDVLSIRFEGASTQPYQNYHFDYSTVAEPKDGEWNKPAPHLPRGYEPDLPLKAATRYHRGFDDVWASAMIPKETADGTRITALWARLCARKPDPDGGYTCTSWTRLSW